MTIIARPLIIDRAGFQRRVWHFDYKQATYYVQETADSYHILKQVDDTWHPVDKKEVGQIIAAFEKEHEPDRSGLR